MSNRPIFSVVIPNWNGIKFLQPCLNSLAQQTYTQLEVLVVDNASTDGSEAFIRARFPDVRLIKLPENRGFTGACNAGIEQAKGAYISLLNNDTEVEPKWAGAIVDAFERHPDVGIVASKMLLFDRRTHFHTAGDYFTVEGRPGNRGVWQQDTGQFDQEEFVFSACGGSAAYRQTMLDQIGILDDDFFFSLEDVDLGWRAQLTGWRCLYVPTAVVYHRLSATGGGITASYYDGRNLFYVLFKNLPTPLWRKYRWQIIRRFLRDAQDALQAWRGEAARAHLRGMIAGIMGMVRMRRKRRLIQQMRTASIEDIDAILSPPSSI